MAVVKLTSVLGNTQKLDGGAMFGNVPKAMWDKWTPVDERNRITLACRCLLVQTGTSNILLETGIGAFFSPKLKDRFGVQETEHCLLASLKEKGVSDADIDVVILSHLHFDHAGGLLSAWSEDSEPTLLFPNAQYVVGEEAWGRALSPHPRDKASFIPELNAQLEESGRLEIIPDGKEHAQCLDPQIFRFHYSHGHTPGMLLTQISTPKGEVLFAADLIPGSAWVHIPVTMGYDRYPEKLIDEKAALLNYLYEKKGYLFYTHDAQYALSSLVRNEKGKFVPGDLQETLIAW